MMATKKLCFFLVCCLIWLILLIMIVFDYQEYEKRYNRRYEMYNYSQVPIRTFCDENPKMNNERFLLFPMLTIVADLGLGNQLFEVFSLLGMARTLNRIAVFNRDDYYLLSNLNLLNSQVPRVAEQIISMSIEIVNSTRYMNSPACCHFQLTPLLLCEQRKFVVVQGNYFQSFKYFSAIESSIREWLRPTEEQIQKLEDSVKENEKERFKTCVHIRRGDFLTDKQHEGTDRTFTIRAIDYLHSLQPGMIYLFGNDPYWSQSIIAHYLEYQNDIRVMEPSEPISDLHFSQIYCDSVLITAPSSTFGWWMGYLSKNMSNVYYRDISETEDKVKRQMIQQDFYPSMWRKMKMAGDGRISVFG